MQVRLDVVIEPGGAAFTLPELRALLPDLRLDVAPALERSAVRFAGRIEADGEDSEVERVVAGHLAALRRFSHHIPDALITISEASAGQLRLQGGSFGADDVELSPLLASIAGPARWRVYVSFRIEHDAHAHLSQLVERARPAGVGVVFDSTEAALAVGFEIDGDAQRVAELVSAVRQAWRQEGSEAECLVEIEGPLPIVEIVRTWSEWMELERRLRRTDDSRAPASDAASSAPTLVELAKVYSATEVLGDAWLSWIDAEEQILGIWRGTMYSMSERIEASGAHGELRRVAGGALHFLRGDKRVIVLPAPAGAERRFHELFPGGALFSDTVGSFNATTQLMLVGTGGIDEGPRLSHVRALDAGESEVFALADGRAGPALLQIRIGDGWGYAEARPWHPDETATDLAVFSPGRIAITAERGSRSTLYLVERENLVYARRIMLPFVAAQIVARTREEIWLTGTRHPPAHPDAICFASMCGPVSSPSRPPSSTPRRSSARPTWRMRAESRCSSRLTGPCTPRAPTASASSSSSATTSRRPA